MRSDKVNPKDESFRKTDFSDFPDVGEKKFPFSIDGPAENKRVFRVFDIRDVMGEGFSEDALAFHGFFIFEAVQYVELRQSVGYEKLS
jgi:hypothetical protein